MLEGITVHEMVGGFTSEELVELHKLSLEWENPTLLTITQHELILRGEATPIAQHITSFLESKPMGTKSLFARTLRASLAEHDYLDPFLRDIKKLIDEATRKGSKVRYRSELSKKNA